MAEIDHQPPYPTYILEDPTAEARLEVVPARGGIVTRWQVGGQDILYLDHARFAQPDLSVRGGIPILFPICGNLPNNTYTYQGQTYTLKQHGFARDLPWDVLDATQSTHLTLQLTSNPQTLAVYPFEFEVLFTYQIQGKQLLIQQCYTNLSPDPMPFSTGLHPYFAAPDKTQLQFEIPATEYQAQSTQTRQPFSGKFDFDLEEIDWGFRQLSAQTASVVDRSQMRKLTLTYDDNYTTLVFWTLKGKDFYCLEPWSAPRNALNTGDGLIQLPPGVSLEVDVALEIT
ncbi:aldose epimerase [Neosynechococcus sphagnicola sy1]|uniref:Aldose epimerase n=1 Tax=Neosynechococcus sphagnicola sy1 TaxID=1497020 RepID=A0A098TM55_9CYAN|nr:aldose epimerase [Neosynechococcus sphagnicola]KGF73346.1 aldose epimerase [Neosynechococcus sphagnicola sy1]